MQPVYKLRDDHVVTAKHMRDERQRNNMTYATGFELNQKANISDTNITFGNHLALINTKADQVTTYTKTEVDQLIANAGTGEEIDALEQRVTAVEGVNATQTTDIASKAPQATTYTKTEVDVLISGVASSGAITALSNRVTAVENVNTTQTGDIAAVQTNLANNYNTKTQDTALFKAIDAVDNKIQRAGGQSALHCHQDNRIDIKVNGADRGYFFQPTGQATTPLGIYSYDKLQLQSALSSTSVYGSAPLINTPTPAQLNTHGFYVGGIDDATKNCQSLVSVYQGNAVLNLSAGHSNLGTGMQDFSGVSSSGAMLLSGGTPLFDPTIRMYSTTRGNALAQNNLNIRVDGKMGYDSSAVSVTDPLQFASKFYVDSKTVAGDSIRLVDNNQADGNKYELKIDNNQLEFRRGANSEDTWLKLFGSTTDSSDGIVQKTNRNNWFYESEDATGLINRIWLNHTYDLSAGSTYLKSAPLRITQGHDSGNNWPYVQFSATNVVAGGTTSSLTMYPDNSLTQNIVNKNQFDKRLGYLSTAILGAPDDHSILKRNEADTRYDARYIKNPLVADLNCNVFKITNIVDGTNDVDVVSKGYIDAINTSLQTQINTITNNGQTVITQTTGDARYHRKNQNMPMGDFRITGLGQPIDQADAATLFTVTNITNNKLDSSEAPNFIRRDGTTTILQNIPFNNKKITGLGAPTQDTDASTKKYVDDLIISQATPTDLQDGAYRVRIEDTGTMRVYNTQIGNGITMNVGLDTKVAYIYGTENGIGSKLQISSNQTTNPSAIIMSRQGDNSSSVTDIQVVGSMGYFGNQTIDKDTQFITRKFYFDNLLASGGSFYTKAEIARYCAFKETVPDWSLGNPGLKTGISAFDPPTANFNMSFYKITNLSPATTVNDAPTWKQVRENRPWVARISLGDPSGGTPSVVASTNSFVQSVTKFTSDGVSATYIVNYNQSNTPDFIKNGTYLATAHIIGPLSTEGSTTATLLNDCSVPVVFNLSDSGMSYFWEQSSSNTQVFNVVITCTSINIA